MLNEYMHIKVMHEIVLMCVCVCIFAILGKFHLIDVFMWLVTLIQIHEYVYIMILCLGVVSKAESVKMSSVNHVKNLEW